MCGYLDPNSDDCCVFHLKIPWFGGGVRVLSPYFCQNTGVAQFGLGRSLDPVRLLGDG